MPPLPNIRSLTLAARMGRGDETLQATALQGGRTLLDDASCYTTSPTTSSMGKYQNIISRAKLTMET